jgi:hypothetical protein
MSKTSSGDILELENGAIAAHEKLLSLFPAARLNHSFATFLSLLQNGKSYWQSTTHRQHEKFSRSVCGGQALRV